MKRDFSSDSFVDVSRLLRLTVTCLFLGISYVLCTSPIILNYFDYDEKQNPFLPPYFHYISSFLVTLNSVINPCIYFVKLYYDKRGSLNVHAGDQGTGVLLGVERRDHGGTLTTIVEGRGGSFRGGSFRGGSVRGGFFRSGSVLEGGKAEDSLIKYQTPMALETP